MSEQKKRYVREKDRERKREERKKIKLLQKQKKNDKKINYVSKKRREILKQIN